MLNDKEILNITKETKWRTFSTEYEFEEKESVVDSVKIIFNDITRVYDHFLQIQDTYINNANN